MAHSGNNQTDQAVEQVRDALSEYPIARTKQFVEAEVETIRHAAASG